MSINALFDEFKVKAATPKQQLAEYKAQGKKVIGVLPVLRSGRACIRCRHGSDGNLGLQQQDDQPCKRVLCNLLLHDRSART